MTTEELERDWKRYALETFDGVVAFDEKFDECRGHNDLGTIFRVAGFDGSHPDHFAILTISDDGAVRDWGTQGYGACVGWLVEMGSSR